MNRGELKRIRAKLEDKLEELNSSLITLTREEQDYLETKTKIDTKLQNISAKKQQIEIEQIQIREAIKKITDTLIN